MVVEAVVARGLRSSTPEATDSSADGKTSSRVHPLAGWRTLTLGTELGFGKGQDGHHYCCCSPGGLPQRGCAASAGPVDRGPIECLAAAAPVPR